LLSNGKNDPNEQALREEDENIKSIIRDLGQGQLLKSDLVVARFKLF
jgi:hypothetical protein